MRHSGSEFVCEEQQLTSKDRNQLDEFTKIKPLNHAAVKWTLHLVAESLDAHQLRLAAASIAAWTVA